MKTQMMILKIVVPLFIAALSIFVLADKVSEAKFVENSVESIENSKTTVMEFTGATLAASLAISALPDDFASPLADSLADMDSYFVIILMALFIERLILVSGVDAVFLYVIPVACGLYIIYALTKMNIFRSFAIKLAILGITIVAVIPLSTLFTETAGAEYMAYVENTIEETNDGAGKINEIMNSDDTDKTLFEKLSEAFKTAMQGINDLMTYFENGIKKCINSIAILIVTTCVIPIITLLLLRWILKELFGLSIAKPNMQKPAADKPEVKEA